MVELDMKAGLGAITLTCVEIEPTQLAIRSQIEMPLLLGKRFLSSWVML